VFVFVNLFFFSNWTLFHVDMSVGCRWVSLYVLALAHLHCDVIAISLLLATERRSVVNRPSIERVDGAPSEATFAVERAERSVCSFDGERGRPW
jgi:hypothetical protein